MVFHSKNLSEIIEQDLLRLVTDKVQENDTVEYKKEMYGSSDEDKREMLKDITSLANHHGGYLLIGIDEDNEGIAINLPGIDKGNHVERIRNSCLDNIEKRIIGLNVEDVSLGSGKVVVIVLVPESFNAPHMITFKGLNQFWKRHGRQKDKMTIDEIGDMYNRNLSEINRLDRFLLIRKAEILENINEHNVMVVSTLPTYIRDRIVLDMHDNNLRNMIMNPKTSTGTMGIINCGQPYPTINGLRADQHTPYNHDAFIHDYIEVFSSGYIEYGKYLNEHVQDDDKFFAGHTDTAFIVNFMTLAQTVYESYLPMIPIVINFSIYNAKGMWLAVNNNSSENKLVKWTKRHLELGKFFTENISQNRKLLTKDICDHLWQAFHREKSNVFDDIGTFKPN